MAWTCKLALLVAFRACIFCTGAWNCEHVQEDWSDTKKAWCCENPSECGQTREERRTQYSRPYDCNAGVRHWREGWSSSKKDWCCRHGHMGCENGGRPSYHAPYDCNAGYSRWSTGWSMAKKNWCCRHTGKGCPHSGPSPPTYGSVVAHSYPDFSRPSSPTYGNQVSQPYYPPPAQRPYHPQSVYSEPYNCQAGLTKWQTGWSSSKKAWCCHHYRLGCQVTGHHYDCMAGRSNWVQGWSPSKKTWCCSHGYTGCAAPVPTYGVSRPVPTYGVSRPPIPTYAKFSSMTVDVARNLKLVWPTIFALVSISMFAVVYFLAHLRMRRRQSADRDIAMLAINEERTADEATTTADEA